MNTKKAETIMRENILHMLNEEKKPSMRNLSASIGASDSFIQKVLSEKTNPSMDKIDSLCEYFDIESWEMFYDYRKDSSDIKPIMQMIHKVPADMLPMVRGYLEYILHQHAEIDKLKRQ